MLVGRLMMGTIPSLRGRAKAGVTLVECMVAVAVASMGLAGLMSINSYQLRVVHSTHDANLASLCVQERVEQMRIATWRQITDPYFLRSNFYASGPKAGSALVNVFEKITVNAFPDPLVANPIVVERADGSAPVIKGPGPDIAAQPSIRIDVYLAYDGLGGQRHNRQACMVLSNGGVSPLTQPALG
jgi:prepilin-type N-terminal cleavage/methylation domain-containing protein